MKNRVKKQAVKSAEALSYSKVRRAFIICLFLGILCFLLQNAFLAYTDMKQTVKNIQQSVSAQISEKVNESLKLLESLASLELFYEPDTPWEEKVAVLDNINEFYGYMFICFVDQDIVVYTLGEEPASLASREHMQKVYASKQPYVTDSFVAGADGKTLNYTVIVPLLKDGVMTGSLFATFVLDDISGLLNEITSTTPTEAVLISSKGLVMCSTNNLTYGTSILDILSNYKLLNMTANQLEEQMLNRHFGSFQSYNGFGLTYTEYGPVENSNWDVLVTVNFWPVFLSMLPSAGFAVLGMLLIMAVLYYFVNRHARLQSQTIENMVKSVQQIKRKVYQGNDPSEQIDYENIIQLSSKGLNDDLTGTFTRVIFLDRAEAMLKDKQDEQILALCFIDLDNLKTLNDTNGHSAGDMALKKIGSILREYGVKYDGIAGRYGGDEFILILRDIDNHDELNTVLKELVDRLKFIIYCEDKEIEIHCSIGASIWHKGLTLETLISNADKALYNVKCHGKANYSLFLNGGHDEI